MNTLHVSMGEAAVPELKGIIFLQRLYQVGCSVHLCEIYYVQGAFIGCNCNVSAIASFSNVFD